MKKTLIAILFLWHSFAGAQVITGVVCDQDSKLPVFGVYVYLDGTSINTITNNSGKFELKTNSVINTRLVLHHLSYETAIINLPLEGLPDTLYIKERINTIGEVAIRADRFTREEKLKAFREQFLGMTRAGRSCTILNEDDIELTVNMQTQTLTASSDKPIVVVNDYLGYRISFILVDFWVQYYNLNSNLNLNISISNQNIVSQSSNLDNNNVQGCFYAVVSLFTDTAPDNRRIKRHRENVYEQSTNYFFKSFANETLQENKFTIYNRSFPVNPQNYFAIKDTLSQKMISIIPETNINKPYSDYTKSQTLGMISVLYRKTDQSTIYFMTDSFLVDQYGNTDQIDKILFSGHIGQNRAGGMLPIDYE